MRCSRNPAAAIGEPGVLLCSVSDREPKHARAGDGLGVLDRIVRPEPGQWSMVCTARKTLPCHAGGLRALGSEHFEQASFGFGVIVCTYPKQLGRPEAGMALPAMTSNQPSARTAAGWSGRSRRLARR